VTNEELMVEAAEGNKLVLWAIDHCDDFDIEMGEPDFDSIRFRFGDNWYVWTPLPEDDPSGWLCGATEKVAMLMVAHAERRVAALEELANWKAGATGAATIAYPPRTGPHTEEAYCAHRDAYGRGPEGYRLGADVVSAAVLAVRERLESEITSLRDRVRELEAEVEHPHAGTGVDG
jgi:hypothetical protein